MVVAVLKPPTGAIVDGVEDVRRIIFNGERNVLDVHLQPLSRAVEIVATGMAVGFFIPTFSKGNPLPAKDVIDSVGRYRQSVTREVPSDAIGAIMKLGSNPENSIFADPVNLSG